MYYCVIKLYAVKREKNPQNRMEESRKAIAAGGEDFASAVF
jgi:hypothetical protein